MHDLLFPHYFAYRIFTAIGRYVLLIMLTQLVLHVCKLHVVVELQRPVGQGICAPLCLHPSLTVGLVESWTVRTSDGAKGHPQAPAGRAMMQALLLVTQTGYRCSHEVMVASKYCQLWATFKTRCPAGRRAAQPRSLGPSLIALMFTPPTTVVDGPAGTGCGMQSMMPAVHCSVGQTSRLHLCLMKAWCMATGNLPT